MRELHILRCQPSPDGQQQRRCQAPLGPRSWVERLYRGLAIAERYDTYRHKLFTAALLALYGAHPNVLPVADPELTKIMRPLTSPSFMCIHGMTVRSALTCEKKLTSKCCFQASTPSCSLVILPVGSKSAALRTMLSMCPKVFLAVEIARSNPAVSVLDQTRV